MIYPISTRTTTEAWLRAVEFLFKARDRCAYNMILDIEEPISLSPAEKQVSELVDRLLTSHDKLPVASVAGTIFPASHYLRYGATGVFEHYPKRVYPKLEKTWGTYAGRMLIRQVGKDKVINPLEILVDKLRHQAANGSPKRAVYELGFVDVMADLPIYDPATDAKKPWNQPCLAHLSFKMLEDHRGLMLTALYRNHYYVERALGNLLGLSQLLYFVARESGLEPRGLVCHSTFARVDFDGGWKVGEVSKLIEQSRALLSAQTSAALLPVRN